MLGWSVKDLSDRAHVGTATILRVERAKQLTGRYRTIDKIERALLQGGVRITEGSNGEGAIEFAPHPELTCHDEKDTAKSQVTFSRTGH